MSRTLETLIPGLLVSLKTTIAGNIQYKTRDLLPSEQAPEMGTVAEWQTTRVIADAAEYEAAKKARSKARSVVVGACISSSFGLLCPERNEGALIDAVNQAYKIRDEFNATSRLTKISVGVIKGKIASDDEQALRAINGEVAELIEQMQAGAANLDPTAIRDAANKLKDVGAMLSPAVKERVDAAIDIARKDARRLVKAGETAASVVDQSVVAALAHSRTAFLDMDEQDDIAAPEQSAAAVDFDPAVLDGGPTMPKGPYPSTAQPEPWPTQMDVLERTDISEAAPVETFDDVKARALEFVEVVTPTQAAPAIETDNLDESTFGELFGENQVEDDESNGEEV